jgi:ankyrin repeat protein
MWILDNADDPDLDISRHFPVGDRGTILITSRNPDCGIYATAGVHELGRLEVEEAITLILKTAGHSNLLEQPARETARSVVSTLGCLALAIDQANVKDGYGRAPLSWAAENGDEAVMKLLLAKEGVDPDSKDKDGQTPLSWAAVNGHEAVVELLLAKDGVYPDFKDEYGRTPLSWAAGSSLWPAKKGQEAVVQLATDGVDPDSRDGQIPLSWATEKAHEAVVKLLLAKDDVDPDSKNDDGRTPLSWVAWKGHDTVVKLFLAKDGVDPDLRDDYGRTPLSWAAENGCEAVVKLLLINDGVDPNFKDKYGRTPLSWVAVNGHEAVLKLLIAKDGVNMNVKDTSRRTLLS